MGLLRAFRDRWSRRRSVRGDADGRAPAPDRFVRQEGFEVSAEVATANRLCGQWVDSIDPARSTVLSGVGAQLALTTLLAGAAGPARAELEAATGVDHARAHDVTRQLLELAAADPGASAGVGLWVQQGTPLVAAYAEATPATVAELLGQPQLDDWAQRATGGLIAAFPVAVYPDTPLLVASAVAARLRWEERFSEVAGRWMGGDPRPGFLARTTRSLSTVSLVRDRQQVVSRVIVRGDGDLDVHLVAGGQGDGPDSVIRAGLAAIGGEAAVLPGSELRAGDRAGALGVEVERATDTRPRLDVTSPAFAVEADHDLLAEPGRFGLESARDTASGHFPDLSPTPLAVGQARQAAYAAFAAEGFEAAAITAMEMVAASSRVRRRPPVGDRLVVSVEHDRPFGFVVVDRESRLALFAGWIAEPPAG